MCVHHIFPGWSLTRLLSKLELYVNNIRENKLRMQKILGTLSLGHTGKCRVICRSVLSSTTPPACWQGLRTREDPASQTPQPYPTQIDVGRWRPGIIVVLGKGRPSSHTPTQRRDDKKKGSRSYVPIPTP